MGKEERVELYRHVLVGSGREGCDMHKSEQTKIKALSATTPPFHASHTPPLFSLRLQHPTSSSPYSCHVASAAKLSLVVSNCACYVFCSRGPAGSELAYLGRRHRRALTRFKFTDLISFRQKAPVDSAPPRLSCSPEIIICSHRSGHRSTSFSTAVRNWGHVDSQPRTT